MAVTGLLEEKRIITSIMNIPHSMTARCCRQSVALGWVEQRGVLGELLLMTDEGSKHLHTHFYNIRIGWRFNGYSCLPSVLFCILPSSSLAVGPTDNTVDANGEQQ